MSFKNKSIFNTVKDCEEIYEQLKESTLCFTGHRSQKLPWRFNEEDNRCVNMKNKAKEKIEQSINAGYVNFISGMALGFDMICAEIVLELKKNYPDIKLVCAIPCKNQDKLWSEEYKKRYKRILKQADIVRYIAEEYTKTCMLERNDYMLNNSSKVIALYNGLAGGTKSTIMKAEKMGLKIEIIKP
ncbi:MAG: SLOG family protein [Christensenellales bacterium]